MPSGLPPLELLSYEVWISVATKSDVVVQKAILCKGRLWC